jgi:hypothetical protein
MTTNSTLLSCYRANCTHLFIAYLPSPCKIRTEAAEAESEMRRTQYNYKYRLRLLLEALVFPFIQPEAKTNKGGKRKRKQGRNVTCVVFIFSSFCLRTADAIIQLLCTAVLLFWYPRRSNTLIM